MISKARKIAGAGLLAIATALLGINTAGFISSESFYWKADPKQDLQRAHAPIADLKDLSRIEGERNEDYVRRITNIVALHMLHYWVPQDDRESWKSVARMYVPITENYLLHFKGIKEHLQGKANGIEFYDAELGLRRGYGFCSQQAMVLVDILNENGIPATKVGLDGHVVAEAEVQPGRKWILDADYNVVMPYSMEEVEARPEIVRPFYENVGTSKTMIDLVEEIYGAAGNVYIELTEQLAKRDEERRYLQSRYLLKWIIPLVLLLMGLWLFRRSPRRFWHR